VLMRPPTSRQKWETENPAGSNVRRRSRSNTSMLVQVPLPGPTATKRPSLLLASAPAKTSLINSHPICRNPHRRPRQEPHLKSSRRLGPQSSDAHRPRLTWLLRGSARLAGTKVQYLTLRLATILHFARDFQASACR